MLELVVSRGSEELVALPLDRDAFRIGRAPTNDLAVPEPTVSRHQCELLRDAEGWRLEDRSGNGTAVDGRRHVQTRLAVGARIEFSGLQVSLRAAPDPAAPVQTASLGGTDLLPAGPPGPTALRLVGQAGGRRLSMRLQAPVLTIGSDPGCDLVVAEPFVSSFHCRLFRRADAWFICDLGSTNGTRVNGLQVGEARIEPGASIQLGQVRLEVQAEGDTQGPGKVGFFGILSQDDAMRPVFERIERAAPTDEIVLITGESGSGKELVAAALHALSRRAARPLIPLNCSAITKDLLESELFGHEKGAFTGAQTRRRGLFEEADGGSLFLDEIGELALDLQAKLLRVLENGEIRPVGSNLVRKVDTRVLAATHRSLPERVQAGDFREDLFYRINVLEIALPALRERPADIPLLAEHFLRLATRNTHVRRLSKAALERLARYRFPGNVRELKHMITRAAILSPQEEIPPDYLTFHPPSLADRVAESQLYRRGKTLRDVEIETLRQALAANDFNQKAAARELGIARSTLIHKIDKYGIQPERG